MQLLVNIDVDDLSRAEAFYLAAFDLRIGRRLGMTGVELLGADSAIYLLAKPARSITAGESRRYDRHWTPVHLDIVVTSLEAARDRAIAAGARLEADITSASWGRIASFADPFGHGFCLVEFTERGYDALVS